MTKSAFGDAKVSTSFGGIARVKNTERVWVSPADFIQGAVTGTWVLEYNTNVLSLATDDAGTTNVFDIPLHAPFSDAEIQGGAGVTDRGLKVAGLEVIYQVAASALGAFELDIWAITFDVEGNPTAAEIVTTLSFDTSPDTGIEIDNHRAYAAIADHLRPFVDSGKIVVGRLEVTDGTASDVNLLGAIWHLERVEE